MKTAASQALEELCQRRREEGEVRARSARELLFWARGQMDLEEIDPEVLLGPPSRWERRCRWMAEEMARDPNLAGAVPEIRAFRLPRTPRNARYYREGEKGEVTIWLEMHTAWFDTGSTLLHAKIREFWDGPGG